MPEIRLVPCLADNYAVIVKEGSTVFLVDAPEAAPIRDQLDEDGWRITHILITHKHDDHIAGIAELVEAFSPEVIGPAAEAGSIPGLTRTVREGDVVEVGPLWADVYDTPGHTLGHVVFHFPELKLLFSGDTMFALGCGRLFEGTPAQMWDSLRKLRQLPDDTIVYSGHEYTLSNARFAVSIDPANEGLRTRAAEIERKRADGVPTVPFQLGLEKTTSPFLRADDPALAEAMGLSAADPAALFAEIRGQKDRF
ncbi:hydroxyacylglutathione hydrolase [Terrihabitans rhizophilus]|uniref:Hydroxyacylglutathione hydrolase n=1 Tax=Terrihabitans rhizophilus TaxID=3092662 RepID=A0ABU4RST7_9HYPH|nr:hydroxyacylglutathione hydrolase [Terrihabitans sp. PJ23]MDX6806740.1 hydroxyacylglutathione hydrolase [Terrihabitans sp. PJ23]